MSAMALAPEKRVDGMISGINTWHQLVEINTKVLGPFQQYHATHRYTSLHH
jgi:hypothetical protein